ncbi:flavodoxin family protein [Chitinophaga sedimenti]|uniref:flavodoxin domain-containing protein n=1 Tax=Chitinophaga sedimenti TaxID=2033606 RepID=UPI0020033601|nr:flavodoxin family protein [Chitinophaga sedimenti]MCK7554117.1 flavodoxin family protein [Chitinophaga sedimenti]
MEISLWMYLLLAGILVAGIAIFISTRKRKGKSNNSKFTAENARFIVLVGSENGTTMKLATSVYEHLLEGGHAAYLATLNNYQAFPQAEHLIVLTSTYGSGEAPASAKSSWTCCLRYNKRKDQILGDGLWLA